MYIDLGRPGDTFTVAGDRAIYFLKFTYVLEKSQLKMASIL